MYLLRWRLDDFGAPIFDEEQLVDNAPVRTLKHAGLTIEGWSRGAVQTYWRIPELKIGFDFGLQPWSFMATPRWALSHTHMDHVAAFAAYVSRRRMMKMPEPEVFVQADSVADLQNLLEAFQRLDRGRMPCKLVPVKAGDEVELSRDHIMQILRVYHTIPTIGFFIWDRRRKLLAKYQDLSNNEIRDLRLSGVEVTSEVRKPILAYLGDTNPRGLDANPDVYQAQVLIVEATFYDPQHSRQHIHKWGHIHLDDLIERASLFANEKIIVSHASTRYNEDQIRRIVQKRVPKQLLERMVLWL